MTVIGRWRENRGVIEYLTVLKPGTIVEGFSEKRPKGLTLCY